MGNILMKAGCYISIILLGMFLRRIGFFKQEDFTVLSKIVIRITLPAAIMVSFSSQDFDLGLLAIAALGLGGGLIYMALGFLLNPKADPRRRAFEILNIPGYNIGTFAMPFTQNFLGSVGTVTTSIFDVGNAFVCLGGAYGVASAVKQGGKLNLKPVLKALSRSVPFLVYIFMLCLKLLHLSLPRAVVSCAQIIGNGNAFLAMLMIGVGFRLEANRQQLGRILRILAVRYGIAAVLALVYYFLLPFDLEIRQTLVILAFSPMGSAIPGFTADLGEDVGLSSAINSISILCSIVIIVILLLVML